MVSLKLDRSSCKLQNCHKSSFSSSLFCLALPLANDIVVALILILIISQNNPLSTRSSYFDTNLGILLVISSTIYIFSLVSNELLNFQNPPPRFVSFSLGFIHSCSPE